MKSTIRSLAFALALSPLPALAAADPPPGSNAAQADPVIERATPLIQRKDWAGAAGIFRDAVAGEPGNASYHNMYAYSLRMGQKPDMSLVFKHYNEALRLDASHRGAHEYLGEAYLMVGNLAKAKEHLGVLDRLCTFGCDEYSQLKKAIAEHEAKRK